GVRPVAGIGDATTFIPGILLRSAGDAAGTKPGICSSPGVAFTVIPGILFRSIGDVAGVRPGICPSVGVAVTFIPGMLLRSKGEVAGCNPGVCPSATLMGFESGAAGGVAGAGCSVALVGGAAAAGAVGVFGMAFGGLDVDDATAVAGAALRVPSTVISILPLLFRRTKS